MRDSRISKQGWVVACIVVMQLGLAGACGSKANRDRVGNATGGDGSDSMMDTGGINSGGNDAGGNDNGCEAPDVLIVLDRTLSMAASPDGSKPSDTPAGHKLTKWFKAITGVKGVVESLDNTVRFGLELFPKDPGKDACITLSERLQGKAATNPHCEGGELVIPPDANSSTSFDGKLDPETTSLCISTPIGPALATARDILAVRANASRTQYVLLLTDGRDTCVAGEALSQTHTLADASVKTHVLGFDGSGNGVDHGTLNDLACAGGTATGFPGTCLKDGKGHYTAADREGATLYNLVMDGDQLTERLKSIAGSVCCGCVI